MNKNIKVDFPICSSAPLSHSSFVEFTFYENHITSFDVFLIVIFSKKEYKETTF